MFFAICRANSGKFSIVVVLLWSHSKCLVMSFMICIYRLRMSLYIWPIYKIKLAAKWACSFSIFNNKLFKVSNVCSFSFFESIIDISMFEDLVPVVDSIFDARAVIILIIFPKF